MDAFTLMIRDHRHVAKLLEQLTDTTEKEKETRNELFNELKLELDAHAEMEEKIFYPAIKKAKETHEITLEAYEEHHVIKMLLDELDTSPKDKEAWMAKLTVLKENIEHHVEEEENEMFQGAQSILSEKESQELGAAMNEVKDEYIKAHS